MKKLVTFIVVAVVAVMAPFASADPNIPDTGIDIPGHISLAVTQLGTVLAAVIGAWFAFFIIRKALSWSRRVG